MILDIFGPVLVNFGKIFDNFWHFWTESFKVWTPAARKKWIICRSAANPKIFFSYFMIVELIYLCWFKPQLLASLLIYFTAFVILKLFAIDILD